MQLERRMELSGPGAGLELSLILRGAAGALRCALSLSGGTPTLEVHSTRPLRPDHPVDDENCPYTGGRCYLLTSPLLDGLAAHWTAEANDNKAPDWLWLAMEEQYHETLARAVDE